MLKLNSVVYILNYLQLSLHFICFILFFPPIQWKNPPTKLGCCEEGKVVQEIFMPYLVGRKFVWQNVNIYFTAFWPTLPTYDSTNRGRLSYLTSLGTIMKITKEKIHSFSSTKHLSLRMRSGCFVDKIGLGNPW